MLDLTPAQADLLFVALDKEIIELGDRQATGEPVGHDLAVAGRLLDKLRSVRVALGCGRPDQLAPEGYWDEDN